MPNVLLTEHGLRLELPKYRGVHPLMLAPSAFLKGDGSGGNFVSSYEWTVSCEGLGVRAVFDGVQDLPGFHIGISASEASNYSHAYVTVLCSEGDTAGILASLVESGVNDVPMLYLLAVAGCVRFNEVLLVLKNQAAVPWYAKRKYALDLLLATCVGTEQGLAVTQEGSTLTLDTGLAALRGLTPGLAAFLRDPKADGMADMPKFYMPPVAGELPAGYVFPFVPNDWLWIYNRYTRGTLRHVLARALHDKTSVGRPTCGVRDLCSIGPHAESNWN